MKFLFPLAALALSFPAHAYQAGQVLQYEGVNPKGQPCAISFKVAPPSPNASADQEEITDIDVYTTHEDQPISGGMDRAPLTRKVGTFGSVTFSYAYDHTEPFESKQKRVELKGKNLGALTSASTTYKEGGDFFWHTKAYFNCSKLKPSADFEAVKKRIHELSQQQIQAENKAADDQEKAAEEKQRLKAERALKKQQEEQARWEAQKAEEERTASARQQQIDEERRQNGLAPIERTQEPQQPVQLESSGEL